MMCIFHGAAVADKAKDSRRKIFFMNQLCFGVAQVNHGPSRFTI